MTALTPGLYRATVRGVADTIVLVDETHMGHLGTWGNASSCHAPEDHITGARPLIVLDISTWFPHRAAALLKAFDQMSLNDAGAAAFLQDVLEQIEAQSKPARIEEPGLWGVVEASSSTVGTNLWVREGDGWTTLGAAYSAHVSAFKHLIDPMLVREGLS